VVESTSSKKKKKVNIRTEAYHDNKEKEDKKKIKEKANQT
jgi:hypothetical protein